MTQRSLDELGPPEKPVKPYFLRSIFWGTLSGWVIVFLPYLAALLFKTHGALFSTDGMPDWAYDYNASLLLLLPMVQGAVSALVRGRERQGVGSGFVVLAAITALDILVAAVFMREGVICVILASPLLAGIIGVGYTVGRALVRLRRAKSVSVSLVPLLVLAVIGETTGPLPDQAEAVTDTVVVEAPADYVWRYIVDYPDNPNPPDYWLWQAGLPAPTHSVAQVQAVGAHRECRFSGGYAYGETITELEPGRKLVFRVTDQIRHPEIFGHLTFDEGEIVLTPVDANHTRITMTGRYRLHVRPAPYFAWWAKDVTRHIHFRVMGYMKTLAETDYAADKGK